MSRVESILSDLVIGLKLYAVAHQTARPRFMPLTPLRYARYNHFVMTLKRFALTLTILATLTALVYAGPESIPFSAKEMKQVAPIPPACPSWTGFYVGGFGGYKFGAIDPDIHLFGPWEEFPVDVQEIERRADNDLSTSGAELGGLIGYNYQVNHWVFGAEASGGYLWLRNSNVSDHFLAVGNPFTDEYHVSTSFKTHYLATIGGRVGYALCRWLPYVTGGVAFGDVELDQEIIQHDTSFPFREGGSKSETNVGWFVGGGLEYALTNHWRVRAQYEYVDLGETGFDHSTPGFDLAGALVDFPGHSEVELREHNASFAIIYGF